MKKIVSILSAVLLSLAIVLTPSTNVFAAPAPINTQPELTANAVIPAQYANMYNLSFDNAEEHIELPISDEAFANDQESIYVYAIACCTNSTQISQVQQALTVCQADYVAKYAYLYALAGFDPVSAAAFAQRAYNMEILGVNRAYDYFKAQGK